MSTYLTVANKIQAILDNFRGVNKTLVFAMLSGLGAFVGSGIGLVINPFPNPGARHVFIWDAWIGLGIGLTVAIVQAWHLGRLEVAGKDVLKTSGISAAGGFCGGVALVVVKLTLGLFFTHLLGITFIPHVAGWTAEGIVMAFAVSRAIPNLRFISALGAGTAAGFLGGVVTHFGILHVTLADGLKGVFIALALGIAEQVAREAWMVIKRDSQATGAAAGRGLTLLSQPPTLLLGEAPIRIGTSAECQVVVKDDGGPTIRGEMSFRGGEVRYHDLAEGRHLTLRDGQTLRVGDVTLEVGTRSKERS